MKLRVVSHFLSLLTLIITASMLFPLMWAVMDGAPDIKAFVLAIMTGAAVSALLWALGANADRNNFGTREAVAGVALSWVAASFVGCTPYIFSGYIPSFTDAYFEAMSGFTTTGASILTDIESLPRGLLMWRAQTQWLGGMGIVVLLIAILPLLGINMTQLFKAESPGPSLEKTSPRIADMALALWGVYVGLTAAGALLVAAGGMTLYNAIAHSFAAVSTGGFSPHNASIAHYNSAYIDWVLTAVMFAAGANFNLHMAALRGRTVAPYRDSEFRFYTVLVVMCVLAITFVLVHTGIYPKLADALRFAAFQVVSVITTTGFATADYNLWPACTHIIILALMLVGGCAGSTSGAIKCVRFQIVLKQAWADLRSVVHPNAVIAIFQGRARTNTVMITSAACFITVYIIIWLLSAIAVAVGGCDIVTSLTAVTATLSNVGPGLADVGPASNFASQMTYAKWIYIFDMLCGRLELYTVLVLFTPDIWKK